MTFLVVFLLVGVVIGLIAVASNPSPYFAALGLVVVAGMGCGVLAVFGGPFLSMVMLLIYLGGMLVVLAYTTSLAAEPFPESWGAHPVVLFIVAYTVLVFTISSFLWLGWFKGWSVSEDEVSSFTTIIGDLGGVALMYSEGGEILMISAGVLLLTLFVVLELTRGLSRGALRAV